MADTRLLKVQEAEIIEIIRKQGFNPKDFTFYQEKLLTAIDDFSSEKILYKNNDYFFHFAGTRKLIFSPGRGFITEGTDFTDWITAKAYVNEWLDNLKKELSVIDNWDSIVSEKFDIPKINPAINNLPFSQKEQKKIHEELNNIKNQLLEIQKFNDVDKAKIEENFDYLLESSKRVGRKDWLFLFLGNIMNLTQAIILSPETQTVLLQYSGNLYHFLVGTFTKLLGG